MTENTKSTATGSSSLENILSFMNCLFPEPRNFAIRLWDGTYFGATQPQAFMLAINNAGALRRMFQIPLELSIAEAYIRKDFDIEGDLIVAFQTFETLAKTITAQPLQLLRLRFALPKGEELTQNIERGPAQLAGSQHSRKRDREAIQYHYDVGNDFYALWLDQRMIYSCAYFSTETEDLDTAQEKKLDIICRKLDLKPGETLLDIGCGWGGLIIYAAQKYGVRATGITLSKEQHQLANIRIAAAGLQGTIVKPLDYRDIRGTTFDKIVSIGMFEHVGRQNLPDYFGYAYNLLKPGGLFLNHGISLAANSLQKSSFLATLFDRTIVGSGSFTQRYIFPDGELIPVSEVNIIAEQTGFDIHHVENWRKHYARTLRHWLKRLENHQSEAIQLSSESVYRIWKLYMSMAAYSFDIGNLAVNQTLLSKPDNSARKVAVADAKRCCVAT
ncbi:class I SAM-dependent methyltransferase [Phototrophicus methaneseepsis]|uniref:Class I SAM-dependent methyltransferase n=1 Tax=Phototrophicus methaneseepsis TaxID=2710758 RepID=A0A7S8IFN7_9CHLR|nr:cyclopropane-fatty-acyl-phospholipid synthase family protein [Phototrophicus methaneseepsis]QPC83143.1 class I SAM-dependent methyltransferase [Phototrophicus methaneseepsis]